MVNKNIKQWIGKNIKMLVLVLLILSAFAYYIYANSTNLGLTKSTLIVKVSTNLTSFNTPMINNATFKQSSVMFFYKTADIPAEFPEIDINARLNKLASIPASYWASVPYKGEGEYTLTLYFKDGYYPKKGDVLIIPMRIVSNTGAIAYKTTAFWVWE